MSTIWWLAILLLALAAETATAQWRPRPAINEYVAEKGSRVEVTISKDQRTIVIHILDWTGVATKTRGGYAMVWSNSGLRTLYGFYQLLDPNTLVGCYSDRYYDDPTGAPPRIIWERYKINP